MTSSRLYSAVTKYWPRIAAGFIATLGVVELVLGGLTSDSSVELYITAWAATTGGVWFLFEKAEQALGEESRSKVVGWVGGTDLTSGIESIPEQFALLFDRVFGERHLSWRCFWSSSVASATSVVVVSGLLMSFDLQRELRADVGELGVGMVLTVLVISSVLMNLVPDYASLLQTRWTIGWAWRTRTLMGPVGADFLLTLVISAGWIIFASWLALGNTVVESTADFLRGGVTLVWLLSGFFTSVWLWLYAASVPLSRVLLRMNSGVGFLLRVTDVERQPFRSMGFVSVLIVSALFALGLPLVLL